MARGVEQRGGTSKGMPFPVEEFDASRPHVREIVFAPPGKITEEPVRRRRPYMPNPFPEQKPKRKPRTPSTPVILPIGPVETPIRTPVPVKR